MLSNYKKFGGGVVIYDLPTHYTNDRKEDAIR
nr:MAG TPA: hypothetical protein [Caudoviricetes sp.]